MHINTPYWKHESANCVSVRAEPHIGLRDYNAFLLEFLRSNTDIIIKINTTTKLNNGVRCTVIELRSSAQFTYPNHFPLYL